MVLKYQTQWNQFCKMWIRSWFDQSSVWELLIWWCPKGFNHISWIFIVSDEISRDAWVSGRKAKHFTPQSSHSMQQTGTVSKVYSVGVISIDLKVISTERSYWPFSLACTLCLLQHWPVRAVSQERDYYFHSLCQNVPHPPQWQRSHWEYTPLHSRAVHAMQHAGPIGWNKTSWTGSVTVFTQCKITTCRLIVTSITKSGEWRLQNHSPTIWWVHVSIDHKLFSHFQWLPSDTRLSIPKLGECWKTLVLYPLKEYLHSYREYTPLSAHDAACRAYRMQWKNNWQGQSLFSHWAYLFP